MNDLISRQAAIDALTPIYKSASLRNRNVFSTARKCMAAIEELPSEQQWIPCSERLPEKNGRYLATRGLKACNSIWNRVYIINYSDLMGLKAEKIWWDGNVGKSDFQRIDDVVAWMPTPEPYKGEES